MPVGLNPLIRDEMHKEYWSGLLLPNIIILSINAIHQPPNTNLDISHIDRIREETQAFYDACRMKYPNKDLSIAVGIDANVTLPPGYGTATGTSTLPPLPSAARSSSRSEMQALHAELQARKGNSQRLAPYMRSAMCTCEAALKLAQVTVFAGSGARVH